MNETPCLVLVVGIADPKEVFSCGLEAQGLQFVKHGGLAHGGGTFYKYAASTVPHGLGGVEVDDGVARPEDVRGP